MLTVDERFRDVHFFGFSQLNFSLAELIGSDANQITSANRAFRQGVESKCLF